MQDMLLVDAVAYSRSAQRLQQNACSADPASTCCNQFFVLDVLGLPGMPQGLAVVDCLEWLMRSVEQQPLCPAANNYEQQTRELNAIS